MIVIPSAKWPVIVADRSCPTWDKQSWWEKLLKKPKTRCFFMLPDRTLICSQETKDVIDKELEADSAGIGSVIRYRRR